MSIEKCDSKSIGLIVGGAKAELGEFPHMVLCDFFNNNCNQLMFYNYLICIGSNWVPGSFWKSMELWRNIN